MKRTMYLLCAASIFTGCSNQEIDFEDFQFTGVYFSYQTPLRTLILGDEILGDNTIDREHAFSIGVAMGGAYENRKDRLVSVAFAPELAEGLTSAGDTLELLPQVYYEANFNEIVIPAGSFTGKMRIQLTDAFFEDPLTTRLHYVLPVKITGVSGGDSVLNGSPLDYVDSPDPRIAEHWETVPQNYTLFGIKYINPFHGMYLLRGKRINLSSGNEEETRYSARFLTDNDMIKLTTRSLTESVMTTLGGTNQGGKYSMVLTIDQDAGRIDIAPADTSSVTVSGSGLIYSRDHAAAESYNGVKHRTIYLDYTYEDEGVMYRALDSLVFVDADVTFEEFKINVVEH